MCQKPTKCGTDALISIDYFFPPAMYAFLSVTNGIALAKNIISIFSHSKIFPLRYSLIKSSLSSRGAFNSGMQHEKSGKQSSPGIWIDCPFTHNASLLLYLCLYPIACFSFNNSNGFANCCYLFLRNVSYYYCPGYNAGVSLYFLDDISDITCVIKVFMASAQGELIISRSAKSVELTQVTFSVCFYFSMISP